MPVWTQHSVPCGSLWWRQAPWARMLLRTPGLVFLDDSSRGAPDAVGGRVLSSGDMVAAAPQTFSRTAMAPSRQDRSSLSVGRLDLASQTPTCLAVRLATEGFEQLPTDVSDPVRQTILNTRALSTRQLYDNRWRLFSQWCFARKVDPVSCSVYTVLEFLQSLLDMGRTPDSEGVCHRYIMSTL